MPVLVYRITTHGNHTFLEFRRSVRILGDDNEVRLVLIELEVFENYRPKLRITGWKPETHMFINGELGCRGIWIDHEPRKKEEQVPSRRMLNDDLVDHLENSIAAFSKDDLVSDLDNALGQD